MSVPDSTKAERRRKAALLLIPLGGGVLSFSELELTLRQSATRIREFSPYKAGVSPRPVYDRADPDCFPIGGFRGMVHPGPLVRLYRLD